MKRFSLYGCIFAVFGLSILSGCGFDFANRADGTCVFFCGSGSTNSAQ